jgi:hypothetical protein
MWYMDFHNHLDIDPDAIIGDWEQTEPASADIAFTAVRDPSSKPGKKQLHVCRGETNTFYWKLDQTLQANGYRTWITSHQSASMDVESIEATIADVLHTISNTDTYDVNCLGVDEFEDGYEFIGVYPSELTEKEGVTNSIVEEVVSYVLDEDNQDGNGGPNGNVTPAGPAADGDAAQTADDHQTFREEAQTITIDVFPRTPDGIARVSEIDDRTDDATDDSTDDSELPE